METTRKKMGADNASQSHANIPLLAITQVKCRNSRGKNIRSNVLMEKITREVIPTQRTLTAARFRKWRIKINRPLHTRAINSE